MEDTVTTSSTRRSLRSPAGVHSSLPNTWVLTSRCRIASAKTSSKTPGEPLRYPPCRHPGTPDYNRMDLPWKTTGDVARCSSPASKTSHSGYIIPPGPRLVAAAPTRWPRTSFPVTPHFSCRGSHPRERPLVAGPQEPVISGKRRTSEASPSASTTRPLGSRTSQHSASITVFTTSAKQMT